MDVQGSEESSSQISATHTVAKQYVYRVLEDTQTLNGSKHTLKLGLYPSISSANNAILKLWNSVFDIFRPYARGGEESDGRLWWEASKPDLGRVWVRIEKAEVQDGSGLAARGWGFSNRPANDGYHWAVAKSLRDEQMQDREKKEGCEVGKSLVEDMARKARGGHDLVAQPAWAAWHVGPGGIW
ncbi:uncharacterized protein PAC_15815 [Phialocephala subalpina]|uniref:Uncharacterized protein n=1 Tax=Phialocephala subalpina TaxID=576137 RepID=A0A1L7XLI4_9HELO|nr:uncharacterized protein PAC_15815 [Phialocephala subalpina]